MWIPYLLLMIALACVQLALDRFLVRKVRYFKNHIHDTKWSPLLSNETEWKATGIAIFRLVILTAWLAVYMIIADIAEKQVQYSIVRSAVFLCWGIALGLGTLYYFSNRDT